MLYLLKVGRKSEHGNTNDGEEWMALAEMYIFQGHVVCERDIPILVWISWMENEESNATELIELPRKRTSGYLLVYSTCIVEAVFGVRGKIFLELVDVKC